MKVNQISDIGLVIMAETRLERLLPTGQACSSEHFNSHKSPLRPHNDTPCVEKEAEAQRGEAAPLRWPSGEQ